MITKRIVLRFPKRLAGKPIVYKLAKDYDLAFNILKADVSPDEEGRLILEIQGEKDKYKAGIQYITDSGIKLKSLSKDIQRNDVLCTHCGVCVPVCPTDSFVVESASRSVEFHDDNCVVCGLCVKICPYHAMSISF